MRDLQDWLAYIERQHPRSMELGLGRVRQVASRMALGRPAARVIVVGGTNGKGSTVAFVEAIARAAGWRTGAYTSPHLLRYNERVRIDGLEVTDAELAAAFEAVERARLGDAAGAGDDVSLTYFEYGTLAALWLFERMNLDLAVLEVGLGGRLDAVNLVDADVAVITTVAIDHTDWLGADREAIGHEKAGIARAWKPLVLGEDDPPSSVLGHAYAIGASSVRAGSDFFVEPVDACHWRWRELGFEMVLPDPLLSAPVQRKNAATAIAALRALGVPLPESAFARGVAEADLPARLQRFRRGDVEIVVDVGHNPQAAEALAAWLRADPATGRTLAVFAALADKDVAGVAGALESEVSGWFLAGLEHAGVRGQSSDALAERLAGGAAAAGKRFATVEQALAAAIADASKDDRILVLGSFHTASAALGWLHSGG